MEKTVKFNQEKNKEEKKEKSKEEKNKEEKKIDELLQNLKAANSQIFDLKKRVKDAEAFIKAQEFDHFCMALFYRDDFLWAAGEDKKYPFYRFVDVSDAVKARNLESHDPILDQLAQEAASKILPDFHKWTFISQGYGTGIIHACGLAVKKKEENKKEDMKM